MKKISSIKHWNTFYNKNQLTNSPTKFAIFCKKFLKKYKGKLYDLGCGNGRDVNFFNKEKLSCEGYDVSAAAIKKNRKRLIKYKTNFHKKNFCNLFEKKNIKFKFSIYSRFTLHSISYKDENKLIKTLSLQKNLDYILIETRTIKDELYGRGKKVGKHEFVSTHYRRFIDAQIFKKKLKKYFKIIYFKQSKGFAKFNKENPSVLRVIAKNIA